MDTPLPEIQRLEAHIRASGHYDGYVNGISREELIRWHEALLSQSAKIERLEAALTRQADNMAFLLNHATVPGEWYGKFTVELEQDRRALGDPNV